MRKVLVCLFFATVLVNGVHARPITLMVYNVENLFDDVRNGSEYPEFDPSRGVWTSEMYHQRIDSIAEVVRRAVAGGPDIIALQEVENQNALNALADTGLKGLGYTWRIMVPKSGLATNVGVLSRLPISRVHAYETDRWNQSLTRDIVEVEIEVNGHVLHLFDDHWKAKTEGARETEQSRLRAARNVVTRVKELLGADPFADVVVAGDLNESSDEYQRERQAYQTALLPVGAPTARVDSATSVFLSGIAADAGVHDSRLVLYDPWFELSSASRGSYCYHKDWETIDHVLLSPGLFDSIGFGYKAGGFRVLKDAYLLGPDGAPKSWTGVAGQRGYSDHLPLLLSLTAS